MIASNFPKRRVSNPHGNDRRQPSFGADSIRLLSAHLPLSPWLCGIIALGVGVALRCTQRTLLAGLRKLHAPIAHMAMRSAPYAIGGLAAFWTIERVVNSVTV